MVSDLIFYLVLEKVVSLLSLYKPLKDQSSKIMFLCNLNIWPFMYKGHMPSYSELIIVIGVYIIVWCLTIHVFVYFLVPSCKHT